MKLKRIALRKKTISLPDELLKKGLERAKRDNRNFSSYVQTLIKRDANGEFNLDREAVAA